MTISKNQIKYIKSLHLSKYRQMYENFIAEGDKVVTELLSRAYFEVEMIVATEEWLYQQERLIGQYRPSTFIVTNEQLQQISLLKTPKDVLIVAKKKVKHLQDIWHGNFKAFYLDGIQDPGNVGTIIRIADWFGLDAVINNGLSADFFHPKVVQASMGSLTGPALIEADFDLLRDFDMHYYAMDMHGNDIHSIQFKSPAMIILGSEGQGISDLTRSKLDNHAYINIGGAAQKTAESLNVSVVAGIVGQKIFYQGID